MESIDNNMCILCNIEGNTMAMHNGCDTRIHSECFRKYIELNNFTNIECYRYDEE